MSTYIYGDEQGPPTAVAVRDWQIGRAPECGALAAQQCPWMGDGMGRLSEHMRDDEEWCEWVADFIL